MPRERTWENPTGRKGPGNYRLAYYISGHGLGHGVRSCAVIRRLARNPAIRSIWVITDLDADFVRSRLHAMMKPEHLKKLSFRPDGFDVGLVQRDSVSVDMEKSLERAGRLVALWEEILLAEARWQHAWGFHMVLSDVAGIPLEAAALARLPGFAIGNFTWDWIYEPLAMTNTTWLMLADMYRHAYSKAVAWFRLPFAPEQKRTPFRNILPVGLVAEPGSERRFELARATGADPSKPWVLLSFSSLDWTAEARRRAAGDRSVEYFAVRPLAWRGRLPGNFHAIGMKDFPFSDVVASCDAVLSKPGYGILGDCIVNRKPLVWAERSDFREAEILEKAIGKYLCGVKITAEELYAGDIARATAGALSMPWRPKETLRTDGLETLTELIWEMLEVPEDWTEDSDWEPVDADWGDDGGDSRDS